MLIFFCSDLETLITTEKLEEQTRQKYFIDGDRNVNDYVRTTWIPGKKNPTIMVRSIADHLRVS